MSNWTKLTLPNFYPRSIREMLKTIPPRPGVYVLNLTGYLYIGSTENLSIRIKAHFAIGVLSNCEAGTFTYIKYSQSKQLGDWLMREYRLIKKLQPIFNRRHLSNNRHSVIAYRAISGGRY